MCIHRLIYKSIATDEVVSNKTLQDLESQATWSNGEKGITGLLMLSGNAFLQVLEGQAHDLTELFGRIMQDRRHHQVELITFEKIFERSFSDWNLRLVDLHDMPGQQRALMSTKYRKSEGNIAIPEELNEVYALLLDARFICLSAPWIAKDSGGNKARSA
jgi:hypothetical protein